VIAAGYSAVVFDLDGTVADTAQDIHASLVSALAARGLPPVDLDSTRLMIGGGPQLLVERALDRLGIKTDTRLVDGLVTAFHDDYLANGDRHARLYDGAASTLRQLHAMGTRVGLCSNKPDDLCRMLTRSFDIDRYIDETLGSTPGMPKKPDPAPLLAITERLGVAPRDTLYVGDSEADVKAARAAGIPVMLVSYGYTLRHAAQLGADGVIDSLAELVRPGPLARSA
jgi:phosphoglycolate phosphatase